MRGKNKNDLQTAAAENTIPGCKPVAPKGPKETFKKLFQKIKGVIFKGGVGLQIISRSVLLQAKSSVFSFLDFKSDIFSVLSLLCHIKKVGPRPKKCPLKRIHFLGLL